MAGCKKQSTESAVRSAARSEEEAGGCSSRGLVGLTAGWGGQAIHAALLPPLLVNILFNGPRAGSLTGSPCLRQ
jgi:hypothetical protein